MTVIYCDEDLREILGLEMAQGRFFSPDHPSDGRAVILNETAARDFGWENPLGKTFPYQKSEIRVIGMVRDFHISSLHAKIPRMALLYTDGTRESDYDYFAVRVGPADIRGALAYVRAAWDSFSPALPLDCSFLDEDYAKLYAAEMRTMKILGVFSSLAIAISCLGLFGLVSFMTERRRKEIGIRKVLGASSPGIVVLLSREFMKWVVAANLVAWPIGYLAMRNWLQNFAYRIDLTIPMFLGATLAAFLIAMATISFQTYRAATANPADSIRRE